MPSEFARLEPVDPVADLDQAWQDRLVDADVLETAGRYGAAMAARLYALEILSEDSHLPASELSNPLKKLEIHDLDALIIFGGFSEALDDFAGERVRSSTNWENIVNFSQQLE